MEKLDEKMADLKNCVDIQNENGNWNYSPYMMGFTNGLIMALSIMEGSEPKFKSAPEEWLENRPCCDSPADAKCAQCQELEPQH